MDKFIEWLDAILTAAVIMAAMLSLPFIFQAMIDASAHCR